MPQYEARHLVEIRGAFPFVVECAVSCFVFSELEVL